VTAPAVGIEATVEAAPPLAESREPRTERVRCGTLVAVAEDGATGEVAVEFDPSDGRAERTIRARFAAPRALARLRWVPAADSEGAVLTSLFAVRADGVSAPVVLPAFTEDGVPMHARPGRAQPFHGIVLAPGESRETPLPPLVGADRLDLVVSAERAFPSTRHGVAVAEVRVAYSAGDPTEVRVENGVDVDEERLSGALGHPADMRSRVAWRFVDEDGIPRHHDLVSVPLDYGRRTTSLSVRDVGGGAGPTSFRVLAATLSKRSTAPPGSRLAVSTDGAGGRETARLADPRPFADVLAAPGRETVARTETVGREDRRATVTFATPLPAAVSRRRAATETALVTCAVLAAFLAALLAVDAFQRFRRLRSRLVWSVLAAALLPVGVTIVLADRRNAARLEEERETRLEGWLALARSAIEDKQRQALSLAAHGLLQIATAPAERADPTRLRESTSVFRRAAVPGGAAAAVVVKGRDLGVLAVEPEAAG
jgi:hypothetical protein